MAQGSVEPPAASGQAGTEGKAAIYSVELSVFEGPLDLLLHLVRRHELDILDIPIAFVAEKYLEYLHLMRSLDLEIAGDYLVMAATLAWLKSRELLPQGPREGEQAGADDEEGEDPREALIRRLVEYERFKSAAAELDALPISGRDVFARGADIDIPPLDPGLAPVTLFRLAEAYYRVLTRAKINKTHDVTIELVTVAQRMQQLTLMLDERQEFDFEGLFFTRTWSSEHELRTMLVVTLMSVLELVKLGVARVQQVPDTDAIRVYRLAVSDEARKLLESYDEEQSFGAPAEPPPGQPPQPTEAELDALEERTLLAEALAGLDGTEEETAPADEIGVLAEVLDPASLEPDSLRELDSLGEATDLGPEALTTPAANSAGTDLDDTDEPDTAERDSDERDTAERDTTTPLGLDPEDTPTELDFDPADAPAVLTGPDPEDTSTEPDIDLADAPAVLTEPDPEDMSTEPDSDTLADAPAVLTEPDPEDISPEPDSDSLADAPAVLIDPDPEDMSTEPDSDSLADAPAVLIDPDPEDTSTMPDRDAFADAPAVLAEPDPEDTFTTPDSDALAEAPAMLSDSESLADAPAVLAEPDLEGRSAEPDSDELAAMLATLPVSDHPETTTDPTSDALDDAPVVVPEPDLADSSSAPGDDEHPDVSTVNPSETDREHAPTHSEHVDLEDLAHDDAGANGLERGSPDPDREHGSEVPTREGVADPTKPTDDEDAP